MTLQAPEDRAPSAGGGFVKSPHDLAGGLFLLAIAAVGFAGAFDLSIGQLSEVGPGMLPKGVSLLVGLFGIALLVQSVLVAGPSVEAWAFRGPFFVLGAFVLFGLTINPLGLACAGPLAVIFSSLADRETRPLEIAVFSMAITAVCVLLFKYVLGLPIPVFPFGYDPF